MGQAAVEYPILELELHICSLYRSLSFIS